MKWPRIFNKIPKEMDTETNRSIFVDDLLDQINEGNDDPEQVLSTVNYLVASSEEIPLKLEKRSLEIHIARNPQRLDMAARLIQVSELLGESIPDIAKVSVKKHSARHPTILFNTIPKSGTLYITDRLRNGLNSTSFPLSNGYFPFDNINYYKIKEASRGGIVCAEHINANDINKKLLKYFISKWVIHLRDPRSVTLSWTHHLNSYFRKGGQQADLAYFFWNGPEDKDYFNWNFEDQISWNLQHFLPDVVSWMEGWIHAAENWDSEIKITTYEDMVSDTSNFFSDLFAYYDLEPNTSIEDLIADHTEKRHFRIGQIDEWRTAFTETQKQTCREIIPDYFFDRMQWQK